MKNPRFPEGISGTFRSASGSLVVHHRLRKGGDPFRVVTIQIAEGADQVQFRQHNPNIAETCPFPRAGELRVAFGELPFQSTSGNQSLFRPQDP